MTIQQNNNTNLRFSQVKLEPTLISDCLWASLAAYGDYSKPEEPLKLPPGFKYIGRFTGFNKVLGIGSYEERFGLILQSMSNPNVYLIAFRGTATISDGYEDIWVNTTQFIPYNHQKEFPKNVTVADGFNSIYSSDAGNMEFSMQKQLFDKLANLPDPPQEIIVTGHSLGGALASLFALDAAHNFGYDVEVKNITFASPRVGQKAWQYAYNKEYELELATYRIANYYDWVASLPPSKLYFDYHHVGQQFLVSFYVKGWLSSYYISQRHSLKNYLTVLDYVLQNPQQIYVGEFPDAYYQDLTMESTIPPSPNIPSWVDLMNGKGQMPVFE